LIDILILSADKLYVRYQESVVVLQRDFKTYEMYIMDVE